MYDKHIQTTVTVRGLLVSLVYFVTKEWSVEWWLNEEVYATSEQFVETQSALEMLETLLRVHEHEHISNQLINEFESRQYASEQSDAVLFEKYANKDIPF
jgi:hypothetical protein